MLLEGLSPCSNASRISLSALRTLWTELPFCLPGRILSESDANWTYDLHGEVYDRFCEEQIAIIVTPHWHNGSSRKRVVEVSSGRPGYASPMD